MTTRLRLATASEAERSAAFDAVHKVIRDKLDSWNSIFRGRVIQELESETGRSLVVKAVDAGLDAAEKVRDKKKPAARKKRG